MRRWSVYPVCLRAQCQSFSSAWTSLQTVKHLSMMDQQACLHRGLRGLSQLAVDEPADREAPFSTGATGLPVGTWGQRSVTAQLCAAIAPGEHAPPLRATPS